MPKTSTPDASTTFTWHTMPFDPKCETREPIPQQVINSVKRLGIGDWPSGDDNMDLLAAWLTRGGSYRPEDLPALTARAVAMRLAVLAADVKSPPEYLEHTTTGTMHKADWTAIYPQQTSTATGHIADHKSADWIEYHEGIRPERLSENKDEIGTMTAPKKYTDFNGNRPRVLYHVKNAVKLLKPQKPPHQIIQATDVTVYKLG